MHNRIMRITTEDVVKVEENYIFVAWEINAICMVDFNDKKIKVIDKIPDERPEIERACSKICVIEEKIFFIPMNSENINVYNIKTGNWNKIQINNGLIKFKFMQAILFERELYLIGCFYPSIICLNIDTYEIKYIDLPYNQFISIQKQKMLNYFRVDCAVVDSKLYLASCLENKILKYDLKTGEWEWISVGNKGNRYVGICWDGKLFCLAPFNGNYIFSWDGKGKFEKYTIDNEDIPNFRFIGVVLIGKKVFFPAKMGKYSYRVDVENFKIERIEESYYFYKNIGDEIVYCTNGGILGIEKNGKKDEVELVVDVKETKKTIGYEGRIYANLFEKDGVMINENGYISLGKYIVYMGDV